MNSVIDLIWKGIGGVFWFVATLLIIGCSLLAYMYWTDELGDSKHQKLTTKILIIAVIGIGTFVIAGGMLFGSGGAACPVYGC